MGQLSNMNLLDSEVAENITNNSPSKNDRLNMIEQAANGSFIPPKEVPMEDRRTASAPNQRGGQNGGQQGMPQSVQQVEPTREDDYSPEDTVPSYDLESYKRKVASKKSSDGKILGIPKTAFYVGVGALALVGLYFGYKKFFANKKVITKAPELGGGAKGVGIGSDIPSSSVAAEVAGAMKA